MSEPNEDKQTPAKLKTGARGSLLKWVTARAAEIGKCCLCERTFGTFADCVEPVGDHCHKTGFMRDTICRGCNGKEGAVIAKPTPFAKNMQISPSQWLRNLADYYELHSTPQTNYFHPSHKNEAEKAKATRHKRALAAAKRRAKKRSGD
jgi:hypothetical protein